LLGTGVFRQLVFNHQLQAPLPDDWLEHFSSMRVEPLLQSPHRRFAGKEATMDLSMRLNVLAALLSLGFIAAIVVGMV
jgi:hypothetical protein